MQTNRSKRLTIEQKCDLLMKHYSTVWNYISSHNPSRFYFGYNYTDCNNNKNINGLAMLTFTDEKLLPLLSGPAVAYNRNIILVTRRYDNIPSSDYIYVVRLV